jgi:thiol:disulfide interchange protein DsbA
MARAILKLVFAFALVAGAPAFAQDGKVLAVLGLGKNYREIPQQPVGNAAKVEVIDFFFYGCPYCNELRPSLERWRTSLPADVEFRRMPVIRHDSWEPLARTYFTLEALGAVERLHEAVYIGYHDEELHMSKPDVMADWAQRHGLNRDEWLKTYHSDAVSRKVESARKATKDYDIRGTPSLVVAGRYLTSSGLTDDVKLVTPVADLLIELARKRR